MQDGPQLVINDRTVVQMLNRGDKVMELAVAGALNKTAGKIRTKSVRETARRLHVAQKHIRQRYYIRRAHRRRMVAEVRVYSKSLNPVRIATPVETATGVTTGAHKFPGAFLINGRNSGKLLVVKRSPRARVSTGKDSKGRPRRNRLPVTAKRIFMHDLAMEVIRTVADREAQRMVDEEIPRQVVWRMERA